MKNRHFIKLAGKTTKAAEENEEVQMTQIRVKAHLLDKEMQCSSSRKIRFSARRLQDLAERLRTYREQHGPGKPDFQWAEQIAELYALALKEPGRFEYPWSPKQRIRISRSQFEVLVKSRRSIRKFSSQDVDEVLILDIVTLASWAPTNCNQQSLRFIIVKTPEIRNKLVHGGMHGTMSPCVIGVLADMRFYSEGDIECPAHDAGAAIQTMLLASHFHGLGACYTSSVACNASKYRSLLGVHEYEKVMALIWLGHYEHQPIAPPRRNIAEIVRIL